MKKQSSEKLNKQQNSPSKSNLPEKALLKASDVCAIFQVFKPIFYEWLKQKKLKSFKIKSRRYFTREDIDALIRGNGVL